MVEVAERALVVAVVNLVPLLFSLVPSAAAVAAEGAPTSSAAARPASDPVPPLPPLRALPGTAPVSCLRLAAEGLCLVVDVVIVHGREPRLDAWPNL